MRQKWLKQNTIESDRFSKSSFKSDSEFLEIQ